MPLGYDVKDRKLVVNIGEAKTVHMVFEGFVEIGSATVLARELRADGVTSKPGKAMTKERVCANTHAVSRRSILSAVPAMAVAGTMDVKAHDADPVVEVYRDWAARRTDWTRLADLPGHENWDTPEYNTAFDAE